MNCGGLLCLAVACFYQRSRKTSAGRHSPAKIITVATSTAIATNDSIRACYYILLALVRQSWEAPTEFTAGPLILGWRHPGQ